MKKFNLIGFLNTIDLIIDSFKHTIFSYSIIVSDHFHYQFSSNHE